MIVAEHDHKMASTMSLKKHKSLVKGNTNHICKELAELCLVTTTLLRFAMSKTFQRVEINSQP